ncbi:MAG: hypothetical protein ACYC5M_16105, partial [Anaerolineae bacterium]
YFTSNAERMRYARFREEGWPIGSGPVEGACKSVVGGRLPGGDALEPPASAGAIGLAVPSSATAGIPPGPG